MAIRVLIVDDSKTARAALCAAFAGQPELSVVGEAADGASALRLLHELAPDLITMDLFLRAESGLDLAASIMQTRATPIVVITAADAKDPALVFRALSTGALEVCAKLPSPSHPDYEARRARLTRTLKVCARVPVVHRLATSERKLLAAQPEPITRTRSARLDEGASLLLIGASTGGPPVLAKLLRALPRPLPMPVALVQHMATGFTEGFGKWLAEDTGQPVVVLSASCALQSGTVYLACDERHLRLEGSAQLGVSALPSSTYRPSVDVLFESAVAAGVGARTVALLLTGMGGDGARGLMSLRSAGAHTIVQEPKSCAVSSMPTRALELGAAELSLPPDALPQAILARLRR